MLHYFQRPFPWDIEWLLRVNTEWRNAPLDLLMPLVSSTALLWGLIIAFAATCLYRTGKAGLRPLLALLLVVGVSAGLSDTVTNAIKKQTGRVRPLHALPLVHQRADGQWKQNPADFTPQKTRGDSFNSGHAANTMAVAVALYAMLPGLGAACAAARGGAGNAAPTACPAGGTTGGNPSGPTPRKRNTRALVFLLPLVVGYSRLYLGKHYPSDVLAGWLVGLAAASAVVWGWRAFTARMSARQRPATTPED